MQTIQNLIASFMKARNEQNFKAILSALMEQDVLWAAFSPATNSCFTSMEHGENAAYLFSEKNYFDQFQYDMLEKNFEVTAIENKQANRKTLLSDLYRCGITVLVIDNGQKYLGISLFDLMGEPSEAQKQSTNPALLGKAHYFYQLVNAKRADTDTELAMFHELCKASYLAPMIVSEEKTVLPIAAQPDGKQLLVCFTDEFELRRCDPTGQYTVRKVSFSDLSAMCEQTDGLVINPMGVNLMLDKVLLGAIANVGKGSLNLPKENIVMSRNERIKITSPDEQASEMMTCVTELLKAEKDVNAAYLCMLHSTSAIRPSYLFVLDTNGDMGELQKKIGEAAIPLSNGLDLEFLSYKENAAKNLIAKEKPFYKKRRFLFFG